MIQDIGQRKTGVIDIPERESVIRSEASPKYGSATPMTKSDKSSLLKVVVIYRRASHILLLSLSLFLAVKLITTRITLN